MKLNVGQKVKLKISHAKWYLDHPEIYESAKGIDKEYKKETMLHLVCALGEPVYGKIINVNGYSGNYLVRFRVANLISTYWISIKHIEVIK